MKHYECKKFIHLDCEKGMCAITKGLVPITGEGSDACPAFELAPKCGTCTAFINPDKYGVGTCTGLAKENWAYATCGAGGCEGYKGNASK